MEDNIQNKSTHKMRELDSFLWIIVSVIIFALIGMAIAKVQLGIDTDAENTIPVATVPDDCRYTRLREECEPVKFNNVVYAGSAIEKDKMISYGAVGAGIGLLVGIMNASYRRKN